MDLKWRLDWTLLAAWLSVLIQVSEQGAHEERLFDDILNRRNYSRLARPVADEREAVEIIFGISLQQIIDVDEKNEMLHTNIWLDYNWTDYKLGWNKSEYGGIDKILVPAKMLWTPDILLYNSVDEDIDSKYPTNLVLYANKEVNWVPPGIYISSCSIDIRWFPFDEQRCKMKFGSWTYDGSKINLTRKSDKIDMSTYQESGEWKVVDVLAQRNLKKYDCCPEIYQDITYTIHIRRRPLYYAFNLIIPCMLISSMALLTFLLPSDSGEKISLGVTILLSLSVFLLIVAQSVPNTSLALPLLGIYFACIMVMCTLTVIVTTLVLNFHHRKPEIYHMPKWVRIGICEWLAWVLRMTRPGHHMIRKGVVQRNSLRGIHTRPPSQSLMSNILDQDEAETFLNHSNHSEDYPPFSRNLDDSVALFLREDLHMILQELRFITNNSRKTAKHEQEIGDWKFAAMVIDRLCMWIFTIITAVATVAIFFSAPYLME